jgi:hypothetical protein
VRYYSPSGSAIVLLESEHTRLLTEGESRHGLLVEYDAGLVGLSLNPAIGPNLAGILAEGKTGRASLFTSDGRLLVHCILQKADTLNANGRNYPMAVLQREDQLYQQRIAEVMASGECNHPDEIHLDLHNLSHLVTRTWWDGKALMGELEILVSPQYVEKRSIQLAGDKIAYYLEKNMKLGISSRGLGSVKKVGNVLMVQNDFGLIAYDLVQRPSTPGSYLYPGPADENSAVLREGIGRPSAAPNSSLVDRLNRFGSRRG